MKVRVLRGGTRRSAARARREARIDTADSGVAAVGCDGRWALLNISAAVARQLDGGWGAAALGAPGLAEPDVRAIVLTDAQLEHAGGLLALRRGAPIDLYATPAVFEELTGNLPVLPALQHYCGVHWRVIPVAGDRRVADFRVEGLPSLAFTALAVAARPWPHSSGQRPVVGDSIHLVVRDLHTGGTVFCAPELAPPESETIKQLERCDCVLIGAGGAGSDAQWFDWIERLPARHKLLLAATDAAQERRLARRGIALAGDGMEIEL